VRLITGDTDVVSEGGGSHSGRSMRLASIVMGKASEALVAKGKEISAHVLEAAQADIDSTRGVSGEGDGSFDRIFEAAAAALGRRCRGASRPACAAHTETVASVVPYGCQVCEVEVDPETASSKSCASQRSTTSVARSIR